MLELDRENFEKEVMQGENPVLVDFWGPKCEKCLELMPFVEKLEEKYGDNIKFCKLDVSKARRLAMAQGVIGLPAVIVYQGGNKVKEVKGDITVDDIEKAIIDVI